MSSSQKQKNKKKQKKRKERERNKRIRVELERGKGGKKGERDLSRIGKREERKAEGRGRRGYDHNSSYSTFWYIYQASYLSNISQIPNQIKSNQIKSNIYIIETQRSRKEPTLKADKVNSNSSLVDPRTEK